MGKRVRGGAVAIGCALADAPALGVAGLAVGLRLLGGPRTIDDAYISFRYAQNIAEGHGFVYNLGQHVLGTTTPLYTLLLAALLKLTPFPLPTLGLAVSACADGLTTVLLWLLIVQAGGSRLAALLGSLAFATATATLFYAESGMETSLFTCLLVLCWWGYSTRRDVLWGIAGGLALLTRPEAVLLVAVLTAGRLVEAPRAVPWRSLAAFCAVVAPWVVWATWYFGQPISQSIIAKGGAVYHIAPAANQGAFESFVGGLAFGSPFFIREGLALFLVAAAALWSPRARAAAHIRPALAFIGIFIVAYSLVGRHGQAMADWYPIPLTPFLCAVLFTGLDMLLRRYRGVVALLPVSVVGALFLSTNLAAIGTHDAGGTAFSPRYAAPWRETTYMAACQLLSGRLRLHTVIAAPEIGALGYDCHSSILDTVGLITPGLGHYYPLPAGAYQGVDYAIPPRLIMQARPDFVVSPDAFIRTTLLRSPVFRQTYRLIDWLPTTVFGSRRMLIFQRIPA